MSDAATAADGRRLTGVAFNKREGKWRARYVRSDGERVWLQEPRALFDTAEEAAHAYDAAVLRDGLGAQPLNYATRPAGGAAGSATRVDRGAMLAAVRGLKTALPSSQPAGFAPSLLASASASRSGAHAAASGASSSGSSSTPSESTSNKRTGGPETSSSGATDEDGFTKVSRGKRAKQDVPPREALAESSIESAVMRKVAALVATSAADPFFERYYGPLLEQRAGGGLNNNKGGSAEAAAAAAGSLPVAWHVTTGAASSSQAASQPRLLALDCEMVLCRPAVSVPSASRFQEEYGQSTLARVSLVECHVSEGSGGALELRFETLLDEYVRTPEGQVVTDLLTHVSGVTAAALSSARLTHAEVLGRVAAQVGPCDLVVGHSLWSDYTSLRLWHGNLIDTACLCRVRGMDNVTLSLKDLATEVLLDKAELNSFQAAGESHDSVADAEWAVRVMFRLLELAETRRKPLPLVIDELPQRFLSRLNFSLLPPGCDEETVREVVLAALPGGSPHQPPPFEVKPVRWSQRKDGAVVGSSVVEFADPATCKLVFGALKVAPSGCGGYARSGPCYASGFPDRQGNLRKLIQIVPKAPKQQHKAALAPNHTCEVISFLQVQLPFRKTLQVKTTHMGRVLGPQGRTVLMIQQTTGSRITVARQPDRKARDGAPGSEGEFLIEADLQPKLNNAVQVVHRALKLELKLE